MLYADVGDSVQRGFDEFATWVPRFAAFLAILIVGYFVAKIVAGLVRKLLERAGFDRALHSGTAGTWIARVTSRPSDLLGHDAHDLVDQELRALWTERLPDRSRADDVGHEHGDDSPLTCRNGHI